MQATASARSSGFAFRLAFGFLAAFVATLTFHQTGLAVLHAWGLTRGIAWAMAPVPPFGVPHVISLAFWGGVWGLLFVLAEPYFIRGRVGYWLSAILFGAIFPTLLAWFVVLPLKGIPAGGGFHYPGVLVGPIVNALWGLGTALILAGIPGAGRRPD